MSDIFEAATAQFKAARGDLDVIEVPEWEVDSKPAKIFYYGKPNVSEFLELSKYLKGDEINYEVLIRAFMLFARNEDGRRLFPDHTKTSIYESYDPDIITRIVADMGIINRLFGNDPKNA